jgi:hypothetical protein
LADANKNRKRTVKNKNKRACKALLRVQAPILKTLVPQFGHEPFVAGFPFLSLTFWAPEISTFFLHFTQ